MSALHRLPLWSAVVMIVVAASIPLSGCGGVPPAAIGGGSTTGGTDSANVIEACNTTYYNPDFGFGFDLPNLATLERFDDEPDFLFSAAWFFGADVSLLVAVQDLPESTVSFGADAFAVWIERARVATAGVGGTIIVDTDFTLANGDLGHILISTLQGVLGSYQVFTVKDNVSYSVSATAGLPVNESDDALLTQIVMSVCVD